MVPHAWLLLLLLLFWNSFFFFLEIAQRPSSRHQTPQINNNPPSYEVFQGRFVLLYIRTELEG